MQSLAAGKIRTVLGDIEPHELGNANAHEHLLMRSPLLRGEELDDPELSCIEATKLQRAGIDALVELTPIGVGRNPEAIAEISERSGLHIVMATGIHREAHYTPEHWIHRTGVDRLVELFVRDIIEGCDGVDYSGPLPEQTGVRAGVIKVGVGYWQISKVEHRVLEAAGEAHRRTGAPVVCHLELGTAAWEVLETLESAGVPADRIALAHVDRNPDPGLHAELAATGAYLGYDGFARAKYWPDSVLLDCLVEVAEKGGADRLLLGGDLARRSSFLSYGGMPGLTYLPERFVPRLKILGDEGLVHKVLTENPARLLAFSAPDVL